jgi:serine/threonine protein kinase
MSDLTGQTLGNYRIVERIGRGGMATVYKAYQPALERYVAVKVIHQQLASDEEQFLKRFHREAKSVATLRHPNIVQVFDFGIQDDLSYMVMEYLDGTTLKAELNALAQKGETMPLAQVLSIFQDIAKAVAYAHRRGMIHRDIKPGNVMLTSKGVVLTDFGVARIVGGAQYTATGAVTGTPAYMSPEQGQGERGDERSDVYALSVVLYEMVTGRVPFDADTPLAVIFKHISDPLPLPRQLNPAIPEAVEQVLLKGLAKEPDDRYQAVAEMSKALADAASSEALAPAPETVVFPTAAVDEEPLPATVDERVTSPTPELAQVEPAQVEPPSRSEGPSQRQEVRFSARTWQGIALALLLIALVWGTCGLLTNAIPGSESAAETESTGFCITRGFCLGPAFALLFLAYLSFMAGRRRERGVHCSELASALGAAVGLVIALLGCAIFVQPDPSEGDRVFASILFLIPGLFVVGVSGLFWALVARKK